MRSSEVQIKVPQVGLIVLVGASGSGKSTFARKHFADTEVVSSDRCRAMVSDNELDQTVSGLAFDLVHNIVDKRLQLGRLTVVDATNVEAPNRKRLLDIARRWDVLATAIVFDVSLDVCLAHNNARQDRKTPEHVIKRQQRNLRRGLRQMGREKFGRVYAYGTPAEIDAITVERTKLWNDKTDQHGPFDIIGDIHGCHLELVQLLDKLGYDTAASPISHPDGRRVVFVGDLVDRGPDSPAVLELAMSMVEAGTAFCVIGNHENKLARALNGRNVKRSHGLAETMDQLELRGPDFKAKVLAFIESLISHYVFDEGRLVVAHAGLPERYHGRASGRVRSLSMYGETDGETDEFGFPVRYPWADDYRGKAVVVYGHTPVPVPEWVNNTICLDTGAVFGGELAALRWPEKELVAVESAKEYYEATRPLDSGAVGSNDRKPNLLDIDDVRGSLRVETTLAGRLRIPAEQTAPALEVMSRFGTDPRWLVYLPPTMAPVETSNRPELLEHPEQAFAYFGETGVGSVVCEEKHMGSRAVVVVARNADVAGTRFGVVTGQTGAVFSRTGRRFFNDESLTEPFLGQMRAAIDGAGWWETHNSDWFVLDCELLPWSSKATELIRRMYAATGAAGTNYFAAANEALAKLSARPCFVNRPAPDETRPKGVDAQSAEDMEALMGRTSGRAGHMSSYIDAYRRYCWDVDGLDGVKLAPFQILAAEGEVFARRPHQWHLEQIDQLASQDPDLFHPTQRRFVDLSDPSQVAGATQWWTDLTSSGGEGMVVKPADSIVNLGPRTPRSADQSTDGKRLRRAPFGLVQPGVKCRGPEYLRIIYGPEYLEPQNLNRLRKRGVGRKSALARREFALGIEALDRFVAGCHLADVHQCVFSVLALETDEVDPRL